MARVFNLKILLTNLVLDTFTGSETFVFTLGESLRNLGHEVFFYTHIYGKFADHIKKRGYEVYSNKKLPDIKFDIVWFQHNETVADLYDKVRKFPKTFISHGVLPDSEKAFLYEKFPMEAYLGVSEETLSGVISTAGIDSFKIKIKIIRNIVDTDNKYKLKTDINEVPTNVLVLSNYIATKGFKYIPLINDVCMKKNIKCEFVGSPSNHVDDVVPFIEKSDIVIGIGRCAYEGMALGRNVLVFDYQGMEGMITSKEDYYNFRTKNMSGRYKNNFDVTFDDLSREFDKYKKEYGKMNRELIELYHSPKVVIEDVINLFNEVLNK